MEDIDLERTAIKDIIEGRGKHPFEDLSRDIIGAAVKVHRTLGPGFLEYVYEEALKIEFTGMDFHHESQKEIKIMYHGVEIGTHRLDLVVERQIILEIKAVKELADIHFAQLRSYLKATGLKVGLLLNFAKPTLEVKRIVN
ncbi:MAG: GxxExxY protein [Deltaproteobacteria bacterium]|nr:GxxExxY protein [Deltaproteobacteria bacterium]